MKILVSAYACEPGLGSEPGVGWNYVVELAKRHDVWVLTRGNNADVIEAELSRRPIPRLRPVYYDLPRALRWWKRGRRGVQVYYYVWQLGAYRVARKLQRRVLFDFAQHLTFVRYWAPSACSFLPVPFVWGPVGGGESTPRGFIGRMSFRGMLYEVGRLFARRVAEMDPLVRHAARKSIVAFATTDQTAARLSRLGAGNVHIVSQVALAEDDLQVTARARRSAKTRLPGVRFISVGNLIAWKGFDLGLRAFALAAIEGSDYEIVGDGPERNRLVRLAQKLGVRDRTTFVGRVPREEVLARLEESDALVHPSLHDSGGWSCLEALGAGKPVICLDTGGPKEQVTPDCGFVVTTGDAQATVQELADSMRQLASSESLRLSMERCARARARELGWSKKVDVILAFVAGAIGTRGGD